MDAVNAPRAAGCLVPPAGVTLCSQQEEFHSLYPVPCTLPGTKSRRAGSHNRGLPGHSIRQRSCSEWWKLSLASCTWWKVVFALRPPTERSSGPSHGSGDSCAGIHFQCCLPSIPPWSAHLRYLGAANGAHQWRGSRGGRSQRGPSSVRSACSCGGHWAQAIGSREEDGAEGRVHACIHRACESIHPQLHRARGRAGPVQELRPAAGGAPPPPRGAGSRLAAPVCSWSADPACLLLIKFIPF